MSNFIAADLAVFLWKENISKAGLLKCSVFVRQQHHLHGIAADWMRQQHGRLAGVPKLGAHGLS